MTTRPTIAITTGEPAGIGPEIALRAAWELRQNVLAVLIGDFTMLSDLAVNIEPAIKLQTISLDDVKSMKAAGADTLAVIDCPLVHPAVAGQLDVSNSAAMLQMLDIAIDGAQRKLFDAVVTAPLQKSIINEAGVPFSGHTEYLAEKTQTEQVVMMLAGSVVAESKNFPMRVALATTHLPLKDVAASITMESLVKTITIIDRDLRRWFGIPAPRILVSGLNPHAGEGGYLGTEEIDVIAPAIASARALKHRCDRPLSGGHAVSTESVATGGLRAGDVSRSGIAGLEACEFWSAP